MAKKKNTKEDIPKKPNFWSENKGIIITLVIIIGAIINAVKVKESWINFVKIVVISAIIFAAIILTAGANISTIVISAIITIILYGMKNILN